MPTIPLQSNLLEPRKELGYEKDGKKKMLSV